MVVKKWPEISFSQNFRVRNAMFCFVVPFLLPCFVEFSIVVPVGKRPRPHGPRKCCVTARGQQPRRFFSELLDAPPWSSLYGTL